MPDCRRMDNKKLASMLGLAQKAGKLVSGEFAVEMTVKNNKALLLLLAADSSDASKKNYRDMAAFYNVPLYEILSKQELGEAIGKAQRAAMAVTDSGFSRALEKLMSTT